MSMGYIHHSILVDTYCPICATEYTSTDILVPQLIIGNILPDGSGTNIGMIVHKACAGPIKNDIAGCSLSSDWEYEKDDFRLREFRSRLPGVVRGEGILSRKNYPIFIGQVGEGIPKSYVMCFNIGDGIARICMGKNRIAFWNEEIIKKIPREKLIAYSVEENTCGVRDVNPELFSTPILEIWFLDITVSLHPELLMPAALLDVYHVFQRCGFQWALTQ